MSSLRRRKCLLQSLYAVEEEGMSAIEQRARDLLAAEYIAQGRSEPSIGQPSFDVHIAALRAIVAALTPPEGFVLVPVEPPCREVWSLICGDGLAGINRADSNTPDAERYEHFGWFLLAWPELLKLISARPEVPHD